MKFKMVFFMKARCFADYSLSQRLIALSSTTMLVDVARTNQLSLLWLKTMQAFG